MSEIMTFDLDAKPHRGTKKYPGGQVAMISGALKYRVFTFPCGRRVGKTTSIFFFWVEHCARKDGFYHTGYIATDHAKAIEFQDAFISSMGGDPKFHKDSMVKKIQRDQGQNRWVELHAMEVVKPDGTIADKNTGGRFYFWSGQHPHYKAIQGFVFPFDSLVVDEMQMQHPQLVTEILMPMTMDSDGKLLITGHPKRGMPGNHLFRTYYHRGRSKDPQWALWGSLSMPAEANPFINPATIQLGRSACLTPEEEIEEYDGQFVDEEGGVFPNIKAVFDIKPKPLPGWFIDFEREHPLTGLEAWFGADPNSRRHYIVGVDWAKLRDSTVIQVWDRVSNQQVFLVEIRGEDYEDQLRYVKFLREKYNRALVHGDHNGVGEAMGERLQRMFRTGYRGHKWSANSKEVYVRRGQILFKEKIVSFLDVERQREQFLIYSVIPPKNDDGMGTSFSAIKYGHPPKEHDDFVDSFLYLTESLASAPAKERTERERERELIVGSYEYVLNYEKMLRAREGRAHVIGYG